MGLYCCFGAKEGGAKTPAAGATPRASSLKPADMADLGRLLDSTKLQDLVHPQTVATIKETATVEGLLKV